ncbi:SIR2 family NAD-dependent protein deacylase [Roseibium aestuarii]|uniref:protein acetyllysine N-acetyltransferase n=1 Tax=Roseibium aestuarii TaxID=2600299 RepID=A0ABW4JRB0_9HYPH|nr:Sir2 family NAD-dependent protein deacetylase [Roseibium aestuarii]
MDEIVNLTEAQAVLRDLFGGSAGRLVVMTGAGISTESGVPDFRSPGGLWSRMQPVTFQDFVSDPDQRREDWRRRFEMKEIFDRAAPNAAHRVLAGLSRTGGLELLITQNVDGLHQRAGVAEECLVELHGNSTYATCLDCGQRAELEQARHVWADHQDPVCAACGGLLKAAVVSFGQAMPEAALRRAAEAAAQADVFVVIGSSLLVQPAAQLPVIAARAHARLILINREATPLDHLAEVSVRTSIAETFSHLDPGKVT